MGGRGGGVRGVVVVVLLLSRRAVSCSWRRRRARGFDVGEQRKLATAPMDARRVKRWRARDRVGWESCRVRGRMRWRMNGNGQSRWHSHACSLESETANLCFSGAALEIDAGIRSLDTRGGSRDSKLARAKSPCRDKQRTRREDLPMPGTRHSDKLASLSHSLAGRTLAQSSPEEKKQRVENAPGAVDPPLLLPDPARRLGRQGPPAGPRECCLAGAPS